MILLILVGYSAGITQWAYFETRSLLFAFLTSLFSFSFYDQFCIKFKTTVDIDSLLLFPYSVFRKYNLFLGINLLGMRGLLFMLSMMILIVLSIITNSTLYLIPLYLLTYFFYVMVTTLLHILMQKVISFKYVLQAFMIIVFIMHMIITSGKLSELTSTYKSDVSLLSILFLIICISYILSVLSFKYLIHFKPLSTPQI